MLSLPSPTSLVEKKQRLAEEQDRRAKSWGAEEGEKRKQQQKTGGTMTMSRPGRSVRD
jgi:hypothetical protein